MNNPIRLRGIDHVVLRATDVPMLLEFYQKILGATLERTLEELGLYQLRAGNSLIDIVDCTKALGKKGGEPPDRNAANMDHFCLVLEYWDERAISTWLTQHAIAHSPVEQRYGAEGYGPSVYIQDPEGNTVELKRSMP